MATYDDGGMHIDSTEATPEAVQASLEAVDSASAESSPVEASEQPDAPAATPETASAPDASDDAEDRNTDGTWKKGRKDPRARISQLTYEREEAKRQLDAERTERARLAAELEGYRKQAQPAAPEAPAARNPDAEPREEDFDSYPEFVRATARWEVRQEMRQRDEVVTERQRATEWNDRMTKARAEIPDLDTVLENGSNRRVSGVMMQAILTSDRGPHVLHYLASHPEECDQLAAESWNHGPDAAPWMRRLLDSKVSVASAASSGPAPATTRKAVPAPIQPVGASPVVAELSLEDIAKLPLEKYTQAMNARELAKWKAQQGR